VRQVLVGCTGRLQPEHVLKAFESGDSLVCAIGCAEDNCHYLEGSQRCSRRVGFLRSVLDEVGLGGGRLMHFTLPGSAMEDMALAAGRTPFEDRSQALSSRIDAVRDEVIRTLEGLPPNPLNGDSAVRDPYPEMEIGDDDSEE
jgi:coenzyme F420-reducing hydrogenase delta subunit